MTSSKMNIFCVVLLNCYIYSALFYIEDICLLHMHMFLLNIINCILLPSLLTLNATFLFFPVNSLSFWIPNLCGYFNIIKVIASGLFFLVDIFYSPKDFFLNKVIIFKFEFSFDNALFLPFSFFFFFFVSIC